MVNKTCSRRTDENSVSSRTCEIALPLQFAVVQALSIAQLDAQPRANCNVHGAHKAHDALPAVDAHNIAELKKFDVTKAV